MKKRILPFLVLAIAITHIVLSQTQPAPQATSVGAATNAQNELIKLEPGKPIERELAGGQSHSYQITLSAGQYMNAVVEQRGIDVVVTLLGPDGKQIAELDNEPRDQGQETVSQVAEVSGSYRLNVQARRKEATAGRYEILMMEVRAATEQDRALQEAYKLSTESIRLYRAGKYGEAQPLAELALEIHEKVHGPDHPDVFASLNNLAALYQAKGSYEKAEPLYRRALVIVEKVAGPEHPDVANSLINLAVLYRTKGDYTKAEALLRRALAILEKAVGPNHPNVATALNNLAVLYRYMGVYPKAEPLLQRALAIWEKTLGPEHANVTASLNNLAEVYKYLGSYIKAEPLYQRALAIREKLLGPEHPEVAISLNNLAELYRYKGDYAQAELIYQRALKIREKGFGAEHPNVTISLNNLAGLYQVKGDYTKAELFYQRALAIREKVLGPEHPDIATSLNNLAVLYNEKGDHIKAEPLFQRVLAIREKRLGPDHPNVAFALHNLAGVYRIRGDYVKAEQFYRRALSIREKALGPEHPDVALTLNNLAALYKDKEDYVNAETFLHRSLTILEKAVGPEHPYVAMSLNNLAGLYRANGDYAKAESLLQRALAIQEKTLGSEHATVALSLHNLALLSWAKREIQQVISLLDRSNNIREHNLNRNLIAGSERQKLIYLNLFADEAIYPLSLHAQFGPNDPRALQLALTTLLRRKGRGLDAMTDTIAPLRRRASPQDQALFDQLYDARSQLATLALRGPGSANLDSYRSQFDQHAEQVEKLEAEVSARSAEFLAQTQPITLAAVQAAIPDRSALVEFASYYPLDAKTGSRSSAHYIAYVLTPQGQPRWVELGEVAPIDRDVAALRKALRDPKRGDVKPLARALDNQVMRPVRTLLGKTRRVLISPDGALNLVPFAALVDERNRYLVERYEFSYLTSGRDLLRLQARAPSQQGPMVVADPDFGERVASEVHREAATAAGILGQAIFTPLPGTAEEAQALKAILPQASVLTKSQATEAALKQADSPSILHMATHGFFLEDVGIDSLPTESQRLLLQQAPLGEAGLGMRLENPLLRSGLGLAGANLRKSGDDDGILTALETAGLNLWGTKLVVLSACDTGVGEVKNGEGVYGLRRALVLAGAETQVMSLWPVSDRGTRDLMIEYYKSLQVGRGRSKAMRRVQLRMLKDDQRRHPYYWASFIVSGEWANLDGKR
jgi:CHAT domain-containing protein